MIKKNMPSKAILTLLALAFPSIPMAASDLTKINEQMDWVERLDTALNKGGIPAMLEVTSNAGMITPEINSRYYAEQITKKEPELEPLEEAKRSFGLNVARVLDGIAVELQQQNTSGQRFVQAVQLLNLSDWLKVQKSYGNYLLVIRCENLAAVPLAYLTADLSFPMDKITALRDRIMSTQEQREFRKTVLNRESPKPFIGKLNGTQSEQDEQMQIAWYKGRNAMANWFQERNISIDKWSRSDLPDELAIFLDDLPAGSKTTVGAWNIDQHVGIAINGLRDANIRRVDSFIRYRELVGTFPTEPPAWWTPEDKLYTQSRAAFEHAWRPFEEANGPLFGPASSVYEEIKSNAFMDNETRLKNK